VNPVEISTFVRQKTGKTIGLLSLSDFSQETFSQMDDALRKVKQNVSVIVIDLRGNAGGYMPAGVDVANLFLPPDKTIISEIDRQNKAMIFKSDGIGSETGIPLYILVDHRTASASEIFVSALQDNHRATVVGMDAKTFGKGRIQNVQMLIDGSAVAVTKAKYITPNGRDLNGVGITPNIISNTCGPNESATVCLNDII